jgi:hypothetical protein
MLRIKIYIILLLAAIMFSMKTTHRLIIKTAVTTFDVDMFENVIYASGPRVSLIPSNGDKEIWFENLSYGDISKLDSDKSLNIMLYYEDVQKIIFLDNKLSVKYSPIELSALDLAYTPLTCMSYNTGFWVYDPTELDVIRYNRLLEETHHTGNIAQLHTTDFNPDQMKEFTKYLVLKDSLEGLMLFDRYGGYVSFYPFIGVDDYQLIDEDIWFLKSDTVFHMHAMTKSVDTLDFGLKNIKSMQRVKQSLYTLSATGELDKIALH